MPNVMIPKEFISKRKLVAIPEAEYQAWRRRLQPVLAKAHRPQVFRKRPLSDVKQDLSVAFPNNAKLVSDVMTGLKKSSVYVDDQAASR